MYRKSLTLVLVTLLTAGLAAFCARMVAAIPGFGGAPSSYDPHITVEEAVKTSKTPLLVEFYTDTCGTCRLITPWMHEISQKYKDRFTYVMVDVADPDRAQVAQIFGVPYVPIIYVFDFKHMAKTQVDINAYGSQSNLDRAVLAAEKSMQADVARKEGSKTCTGSSC